MRRHRLRDILLRYWLAFTLLTGAAALGLAAITAYVVEDRLIDGQLLNTAMGVRGGTRDATSLPSDFTLFRESNLPIDIGAQFVSPKNGDIREFRRPDGSYVHVLVIGERAERQYLLHDVSDALVVGPNMAHAALAGLACLLAFVLVAVFVARILGRRAGIEGQRLLNDLAGCRTPGEVRTLAASQEMDEMHAFLSVHADVWDERSETLQQQEELVSFLAHELRTPLQSARTSLALLHGETANIVAVERLSRAISRLIRASHAALFLGAKTAPVAESPLSLFAIWDQLCAEFAPLAKHRGQTLAKATGDDPMPVAPFEAVEAIVSNLLANALRHSGSGAIRFRAEGGTFVISNSIAADISPGFGLGLTIVERLCERLDWDLSVREADEHFEARITLSGDNK
ncbi:HAMP domain-containing sensor histidine kinase [Altererythrobacter arenosus]|uniref:histidine kinase n=1 Tax=Altererythrobacter arenosus TaxID=3032592 RepID=A0ABY8FWL7_9SPHN|nr:HAMP domain-containing sensor histidine kinase [Altererythrobacter sp. CAU 1644]WFL77791.1 HAMP domain-containing sensor histidine kinase [Altererythrobacter sp. CAU 1644]